MTPATTWTVDGAVPPRATLAAIVRGAATMLARRPALVVLAGAPELVYAFVDAYWLENLPDKYLWASLAAFPLGLLAFAWIFAVLAGAWDASGSPVAAVRRRFSVFAITTAEGAFVILVSLPLVLPALYYGVHYFFAPIIAVREDARWGLPSLRRSKLLVRKHRLAGWSLFVATFVVNTAVPLAFDATALAPLPKALLVAVLATFANVAIAAVAAQAYARWKLG